MESVWHKVGETAMSSHMHFGSSTNLSHRNKASECKRGLLQDADFVGVLKDLKSTSAGMVCILGIHTLAPISWACKKQTAVSHRSTEAEVISWDTGLRVEGSPA